jgi:hypothetical protein
LRVGIISDTHGVLHARVPEVFAGVDHIIHAGDIGGEEILLALRRIAPVTHVEGNVDDGSGYNVARVTLDDVRFLVTHILPRPSDPEAPVRKALNASRRTSSCSATATSRMTRSLAASATSIPRARGHGGSITRRRSASSKTATRSTCRSTIAPSTR